MIDVNAMYFYLIGKMVINGNICLSKPVCPFEKCISPFFILFKITFIFLAQCN